MAKKSVQPYIGPLALTVQHLSGVIVAIATGGTKNMKREAKGFPEVADELNKGILAHGLTIGLAPEMAARLSDKTAKIEQVRAARRDAEGLAEALGQTEAKLEDEREADIGRVVVAVRQAARRSDESLLAHFEKTIRYHGQAAVRAAKTRKKNAKAKQASAEPATPEAPASSVTPT